MMTRRLTSSLSQGGLAALTFALSIAGCFTGPALGQQADAPLDLIEKGRSVAVAADCMACHTVPDTGRPFSGGYPIVSPLGTIYSTNITPSKTYGIGTYSEHDFDRAVRHGIRKDGAHLYPAMPYDIYGKITDDDIHSLYSYFMHGVDPVDVKDDHETSLPFPFNMRFSMWVWNLLYANQKPFDPDATKTDELNRGAYLVDVLGHCDSCHTPRDILMGTIGAQKFAGAEIGSWFAPNITSDPISGIGNWTNAELSAYLSTGHSAGKNQAAGGMAEAVSNSLQHLAPADINAMVTYLKSVPPIRDPADSRPAFDFDGAVDTEENIRGRDAQNERATVHDGARLFSGYCASCHQPNGAGSQNQTYPSLFNNTATGASRSTNLVATILYGVDRSVGSTHTMMPGFGRGSYVTPLTDQEIADVSNYVLASFGNAKIMVTPAEVATVRSGGRMPFLARVQPYVLPGIIVGIFLMLSIVGIVIATKMRKGFRRSRV